MPNEIQLDKAMMDLVLIDAGDHKDSAKYKRIVEAIDEINKARTTICGPYTIWNNSTRNQMVDAYRNLHKACEAYLSGKTSPRRSGYGAARLRAVQELDRIIQRDIDVLQHPKAVTAFNSFDELMQASSYSYALTDDSKALSVVGANMSQRMALKISTPQREKTGFFTTEEPQDPGLLMKHVLERHQGSLPDFLYEKLESKDLQTAFSKLNPGGLRPAVKNLTDQQIESILTALEIPSDKWTDITGNPKNKEAFLAFRNDLCARQSSYTTNQDRGIQDGQGIAKRNVGMTRVAELLDMSHLIAHAEPMKVVIGSDVKTGVFMDTAPGSDINRVTAEDPLSKVDAEDSLKSASLWQNLADLQVLDYICGNTDRHLANMFYHTETDKDGHVRITGVTGIDNDLSFITKKPDDSGADNYQEYRMVNPRDMRVIRQGTAERILALEGDTLKLLNQQLRDMNFSPEEIELMNERLALLQARIMEGREYYSDPEHKKPVAGKLMVVPDEQFGSLQFEDLKDKSQGVLHSGNYFYHVGTLSTAVRNQLRAPSPESKTGVSFSAIEKGWDFEISTLPLQYKDMRAEADRLAALKERLHKADSVFHRKTGSFRWMRRSIDQLEAQVRIHADSADKGKEGALSDMAQKGLESLYRDLNKAGFFYLQENSMNPSSGLAKERRDLASEFYCLRAPYEDASTLSPDKQLAAAAEKAAAIRKTEEKKKKISVKAELTPAKKGAGKREHPKTAGTASRHKKNSRDGF